MIYCVVPEELAPELYDRLAAYYAQDGNVQVIIDRRRAERRDRHTGGDSGGHQRLQRDRRRSRVPGDFPLVDPPSSATALADDDS